MSNTIPENIPQKQCSKCKNWYPATPQFFHRCAKEKSGLQCQCKTCRNAHGKAYQSQPEIQNRRQAWHKNYFSQPEVHEHNRAYNEAYRNRPEIKERNRTRYSRAEKRARHQAYYANPENRRRAQVRSKAYYDNPENHEHIQAYRKSETVRERQRIFNRRPERQKRNRFYKNQPQAKAQSRAYYKRPEVRERMRAYYRSPERRETRNVRNHIRRARQKMVRGTHTPAQIQELLRRQRHKCYYAACGHAKFEQRNGKYIYHIEHTYPLSRAAGTDIPANDISYIVLACPSCNLAKHDKLPHEWPEGGRLL